MGNCCGGARSTYESGSSRARREQTWQATGLIVLRDSNLKELPRSVASVGGAAKTLDATNNRLRSLEGLDSLVSLQRLVVARNQLTGLPASIGSLQQLKVLNVDSNAMHSLPEQLGALTRLERLQAAQNALIGLPSSFARLQALKVLSLAKNKIATVPDAVGDCGRLEELDLSDNCLQELPESLGKLRNLKVLAADQNRIIKVSPAIFRGCSSLQTLALHENPMTMHDLTSTDGYDLLEARRRKKFDKQVGTGVLTGSMDEGITRALK